MGVGVNTEAAGGAGDGDGCGCVTSRCPCAALGPPALLREAPLSATATQLAFLPGWMVEQGLASSFPEENCSFSCRVGVLASFFVVWWVFWFFFFK